MSSDRKNSQQVFGNPRALMSRADLVRAFAAGEEAVRLAAETVGLSVAKKDLVLNVKGAVVAVTTGSVHMTLSGPSAALSPGRMPFWRVERATDFEPHPSAQWVEAGDGGDVTDQPAPPTEDEIRRYVRRKKPKTSPIVPWSRIRPALTSVTGGETGQGPIDFDRLVERLCKVEWLPTLPRKASLSAATLHVAVDRARRLVPFWDDQLMLVDWLKKSLGKQQVKVHWCRHNELDVPDLAAGERLLALTDLGLYGSPSVQRTWHFLGERLKKKGVVTVALVPCPRSRWQKATAVLWNAEDWSAPGRGGAPLGFSLSESELNTRAERLLRLLSATLRIEPGLLREVRQALPKSATDLGAEADAWHHPSLVDRSYEGCWIDPAAAQKWRAERDDLSEEQRQAAVNAIRKWHEQRAYGFWEAEIIALTKDCDESRFLNKDEVQKARRVIRGILAAVPGADAADTVVDRAVEGWFRYLDTWVGAGVREDEELGPEMTRARHRALLPIDPGKERKLSIRQQGGELLLALDDEKAPGSRLTSLRSLGTRVCVETQGAEEPPKPMDLASPRLSMPESIRVELVTNTASATLCRITKPNWAKAMGRDPYGLWADWRVNDVVQRMRWIPPGKFIMGSKENEAGSYKYERPAHEVRLTRGFWLADTPCTQAMWETVMGENPSYFVSPERPVEQVSWDDVDKFIAKLNESEDPPLRLPTEAEWEYACRAGTETSTYAGELEILGERNGPILNDIAWYGGNSGVGFELKNGYDSSDWKERQYADSPSGTHPVKQKRPNGWGLYDTLGNVVEWCGDYWQDRYDPAQNKDPYGPSTGDGRVFRGGAWSHYARSVRAAYRFWYPPDFRYFILGFRLSRGPAPSQARDGRSPESLSTVPRSVVEVAGGPGAGTSAGGGRPSRKKDVGKK